MKKVVSSHSRSFPEMSRNKAALWVSQPETDHYPTKKVVSTISGFKWKILSGIEHVPKNEGLPFSLWNTGLVTEVWKKTL